MAISLVSVGAKITASLMNSIITRVNLQPTITAIPNVSGTGVSVDSTTGVVTVTAATSPVIQFGSTSWRWADIVFEGQCSTTADLIANMRSGLGGSNLATSTYIYNLIEQSVVGSATRDASGTDSSWKLGSMSTGRGMVAFKVMNMMQAFGKVGETRGGDSAANTFSGYLGHATTTAYDTLNIRPSTGNITGTFRITLGGVV